MGRKKKQEAIISAPQPGMVAKNEFSSQSMSVSGETVATVLAARAKAEVEARFIIAMQRPRDWDQVRRSLLNEVERPGFGDEAWWKKPQGQGHIQGLSIRFAETALRCMGNIDAKSDIIWEDENKRIIMVTVMDLESNISIPSTLVIEKTIERKFLKDGQVAISVRKNSKNETVYKVEATEDDVLQKQNSLISKAIRNGILRLLPGDIQAECKNRILKIKHGAIAKNPDAEKKKIIDGFANLNIGPADLKQYLEHDVSKCTPAEIADLRELYDEIKKGNTTWHNVIKSIAEEKDLEPSEEEPKKRGMEQLKADLKNGRNE